MQLYMPLLPLGGPKNDSGNNHIQVEVNFFIEVFWSRTESQSKRVDQ